MIKLYHLQFNMFVASNLWSQGHSNTKAARRGTYRWIPIVNMGSRVLNQILDNQIQQHVKTTEYRIKVIFKTGMQG